MVTKLSDGSYLFDVTDPYKMSGILRIGIYDDRLELLCERTIQTSEAAVEYRVVFTGEELGDAASARVYIEGASTADEQLTSADSDLPGAAASDIEMTCSGGKISFSGTTGIKDGTVLIEAVYNSDKTLRDVYIYDVKSLDDEIEVHSSTDARFMLWNGFKAAKPLAESIGN